jgi:hypothetical protein
MVEEIVMNNRDHARQEQRLDEILFSNVDDVSKVQHIMKLGFDAEVADEIVERHQSGSRAPVYYERLDFADMDDDDDEVIDDKNLRD